MSDTTSESGLLTATRYDGRSSAELASVLGLTRVVLFDEVSSTLDVVHDLGDQRAEAGTLVLADAQTAGRGRLGRSWSSEPGAGIWLTLLERPTNDEALGVLALRIALALAPALDAFSPERVLVKWPNDVYLGEKKLAGVLVEARWHGARLDWLALGVGINVRPPRAFDGAGLGPGVDRVEVLRRVVPALRSAAASSGPLSDAELQEFHERDLAFGRACIAPTSGTVAGIRSDGALLIDNTGGRAIFHAGSLVLAPAPSLGTAP